MICLIILSQNRNLKHYQGYLQHHIVHTLGNIPTTYSDKNISLQLNVNNFYYSQGIIKYLFWSQGTKIRVDASVNMTNFVKD